MTFKKLSLTGVGLILVVLVANIIAIPAARAATANSDIVFVGHGQGGNGLFISDGRNGQVTRELGRGLERHPSWSHDGTRIAFDSPLGDEESSQIMIWSRDGRGRVLTNDPQSASDPDFSPDQTSIVYVNHGVNGSDIATMSADGTNQEPLTNSGFNATPNFSPDGSRIAYVHSENGRYAVRVTTPDGSSDEQVYPGQSLLWSSTFSPDGRKVLFSEFRGGQWDLKTVRLSDGHTEWLTETPGFDETHASYSPDGTRLLFTRGVPQQDGSELFTSDLAHEDLQRVSEAGSSAQQGDWRGVQVVDPPQPFEPNPGNDDLVAAPGEESASDDIAPSLTLKGRPKPGRTYQAPKVKRIKGIVTDDSEIDVLKLGLKRLGGKCRHLLSDGSMTGSKRCKFRMLALISDDASDRFNQNLNRLQPGRYKLKIVAGDAAGNKTKLRRGFRIR
ncbi:MAG: hypothetical protein K0U64_02590 [Actinomycetia bacterium]|nr:hypothetical protein [Actinomycetes bacterium]